jgi:hypothetical protein
LARRRTELVDEDSKMLLVVGRLKEEVGEKGKSTKEERLRG